MGPHHLLWRLTTHLKKICRNRNARRFFKVELWFLVFFKWLPNTPCLKYFWSQLSLTLQETFQIDSPIFVKTYDVHIYWVIHKYEVRQGKTIWRPCLNVRFILFPCFVRMHLHTGLRSKTWAAIANVRNLIFLNTYIQTHHTDE